MNLVSCLKSFSAAICAAVLGLTATGIGTLPAEASESTALTISEVRITEGITEVAVDVTIENNTDGFLATSFGIAYDTRLTFDELEYGNRAGMTHYYASNPSKGILWFSGASGTPSTVANTDEEVMFTLKFTLPENKAMGDYYSVNFFWNAQDDTQAYWYLDDHTNIIGNIQSHAKSGGISFPDPNAPVLSHNSISLGIGTSKTISITNCDSVSWFSDNTNIAVIENGTITGIAEGICYVYAFTGTEMLSCKVTVSEEATYNITETDVIYIRDPDQKVQLLYPDNTLNVSWMSDNTGVVTVASDGLLTVIGNGVATIYATCNGDIQSTRVIVEIPEPVEGLCGDVNQDGIVSIVDVIQINRTILGSETLTTEQQALADAYQDGTVTSKDSLTILKHLVSLIETLPITP
ncbi:MAG: hypothetical protein IJN11_09530 [Oscillospiraceae bacterium]|nr:hypothetical protein [Oscillospiraceae bacterium]